MPDLLNLFLLFLIGIVAGVLNIIAGGGSFLTLPMLIFLGMPALTANGTNRLAILIQNIGGVWGFHRHGLIRWSALIWAGVPAAIGSLLGVWIAFQTSDFTFRRTLAFLMVALTVWTIWDPLKGRVKLVAPGDVDQVRSHHWLTTVLFFGIGVYGGFVQAGVGFLVLAATTLIGLDLVRGNALKILIILLFILITLLIFLQQGRVEWVPGLVLGAGSLIGAQLGVHLTVFKGHAWLKTAVTVAIILFAIKLWIAP